MRPANPLAVVLFVFLPLAATGADRLTIEWPSEAFRTLQSAIDAAPDGATIAIKPGVYAIEAPLDVTAKRLTFRGAGSGRRGGETSRLVGPDPQVVVADERGGLSLPAAAVRGMFNVDSGDVTFRHMRITGFDGGIVARDSGRGRPPTVEVEDLLIDGTGRGILAQTRGLVTIRDVTIERTQWNGISVGSLTARAAAKLSALVIHATLGPGIYFENTKAGIDGCVVSGAFGGGIVGIASTAIIADCQLGFNHQGGIILKDSTGILFDNEIFDTTPVNGLGGDGIELWKSGALITNNDIHDNQRAAISFFGGTGSLHNNTMTCNAMDIDVEDWNGATGKVINDMGNVCGCGQPDECNAISSQLQPPEPVAGIE